MLKTGEEIHKLAVAQTVWISSPNASSQNLRFPKSLKCRQDGNIQLRCSFQKIIYLQAALAAVQRSSGYRRTFSIMFWSHRPSIIQELFVLKKQLHIKNWTGNIWKNIRSS